VAALVFLVIIHLVFTFRIQEVCGTP